MIYGKIGVVFTGEEKMMQKQIRDIQINILKWLKAYSNDQYLSNKHYKKINYVIFHQKRK